MKTKLLIIATLVSGGMIFNSCQKDNALIEETSVEQLAAQQDATSATENALLVDSSYPGDLDADMITNAPDPFYKVTNISLLGKKNKLCETYCLP